MQTTVNIGAFVVFFFVRIILQHITALLSVHTVVRSVTLLLVRAQLVL